MINSFGAFFEAQVASSRNQAQAQAQAENSARTALSTHSFEIKGIGTVLLGVVSFDVVFLGRPRVVMGGSLLKAPDLLVWGLPSINGVVTRWVVNRQGHYTGAQVYGVTDIRRVDGEVPEAYPEVSGVLDVVFMGVAYKQLGEGVETKAEMLQSRSTGLGG